jgi:hypothetical protein
LCVSIHPVFSLEKKFIVFPGYLVRAKSLKAAWLLNAVKTSNVPTQPNLTPS